MKYELRTIYDSAISFYKKANVVVSDDGNTKTLTSYDTEVVTINYFYVGDKLDKEAIIFGTYSTATIRHIREFLKQNGFKAENKKQIEKDYL